MTEGGARRDTPGFHRQVPMSNQALENASKETSTVMSWLGYGPEIRRARGDEYRKLGKNNSSGLVTWSIVGSKAEGLTCVFESDQDMLKILNSVICLEDGVNASTFHREMTVLRSYSRLSYPGHCRLLLERSGTPMSSKVNDAFCDDEYGREILSNDLYLKNWSKKLPGENVARAGPSLPTTLRGVLHYDNVHAFRYHCPHILSKWAARPRHWPPPEAVQKVVSLGAFLAPVGFKGSEHKDFEWRVCFNAGEIELVNNLNDTQIKVYVLLTMVKSAVLNPRKKEVSSYTLKNIVLWIAEKNPQSLFHERSLLHWLHVGLEVLRAALVTQKLPYYMIPGRNLMAACGLGEKQKRIWISTISEMMNEGPRMILRLPKKRQVLVAHPEPFRWYSSRRMELEMLELKRHNRFLLCMDKNYVVDETDVMLQAITKRMDDIVTEVRERMIMEGSPVKSHQYVFDRMLM